MTFDADHQKGIEPDRNFFVRSIDSFLKLFDTGIFTVNNRKSVQVDAGWYDWFCTDKALRNKTIRLTGKLKQLMPSNRINPNTMCIIFKNNAPLSGVAYDDFRICDLETKKVIFTVIPSGPQKAAELWGDSNNFSEPLIKGRWTDIKRYFKYPGRNFGKTSWKPPVKSYAEEKFRARMLRPVIKEDK